MRDGKQAFPSVEYLGMTLRDWFAGQALTSKLLEYYNGNLGNDSEAIARRAYKIADAMLAERDKCVT